MEKRTILAFVLSFVVLIGWSYLYRPKQEVITPKEEGILERAEKSVPESTKPTTFTPSISSKAAQEHIGPTASETQEKEVRVETPLYSIVFSSRNACIKSFKLNEYRLTKESDSPPVELVSLEDSNEDFFSAHFSQRTASEAEGIIYLADEESIRLNPESAPRKLTFSYTRPDGLSIYQTFRFYPDRYDIDLAVILKNNTQGQIEGNIKTSLRNLPPQKKGSYYSFLGTSLLLNGKLEKIKPKKMKEEKYLSGQISWIAYENDYFMNAIIPDEQEEGRFIGRTLESGVIRASYLTPPVALSPFEQHTSEFTLYMGPRDLDILKQLGKRLDLAINFGFFDIIAKPLHYALRFFYGYVHNYGLAIIILTILIKIIFWPLTHKSYKSMKGMQKLQPLMAKIREKHKNDKQQMQKELMGLYKTYKINPMGGCLPMVIQIPVFFALFRILGASIELRHTPFIFWINDLSAPDRLFNFPFQIPFMSAPYGIPVLTLLMGASMFIQQKMTPTAGDPAQAKIMMFLPIIFTIMFINFPSGLVLYWLVNNILSIGQQYRIKRGPS
ncbi:MAG: membrane protein insertase YidC [Deltaproteobacteria bacterium]|nr:membrane protein insertase YidC [Deltaproteobacteria bacterium]